MNAIVSPRRRGACPALAAPMQTGDGLLARLASGGTTEPSSGCSPTSCMPGAASCCQASSGRPRKSSLSSLIAQSSPALKPRVRPSVSWPTMKWPCSRRRMRWARPFQVNERGRVR